MAEKLTKAQKEVLESAAPTGSIWLRNTRGNTAMSLVRCGLLQRLGTGAYLITPAGRAALSGE